MYKPFVPGRDFRFGSEAERLTASRCFPLHPRKPTSQRPFASTLTPGERPEIEPEIVWAKFKSLAEGARIASRALWA
jgi:hypothetical protein